MSAVKTTVETTVEGPVAPVAVSAVSAEKAEKVERKALPTIEEFKVIEVNAAEPTVFISIDSPEEYAQIKSAVNEMKNVKLISSNKEGILIISKSELNSGALAKYINPALVDAEKVVIKITYGEYEKMRISAKIAGTSKAKIPLRSATTFFDRTLTGMVDEGSYNYIYGVEGSDFTKALNTKIARVVKTLYAGKLYSDDIKPENRGFHKTITRIPVNESGLRTNDNYSFFFKWEKIVACLGEVDGKKCIDTIVAIFKEVYPSLTIDTTKDLYIECLKSVFSEIGKDRLVWDEAAGKIVSKREAIEKEKEAKKLAVEAAKEAKKAEKAAAKKAEKAEKAADLSNEEVAVGGISIGGEAIVGAEVKAPVLGAEVNAPVLTAPATPVVATPVVATPVTAVTPNSLINGVKA